VYAYEKDKLIRIVNYDGEGKIALRQINSRDKDGRLREETYYDATKARGKTVYKYDGRANISEALFYLATGARAVAPIGPWLDGHRVTYVYDEQRKPIEVVAYEPNGELKQSWQYTYNSKGQITEMLRESAWSRLTFVYTYEYDTRGNWTRQVATI